MFELTWCPGPDQSDSESVGWFMVSSTFMKVHRNGVEEKESGIVKCAALTEGFPVLHVMRGQEL